MKVRVNMAMFVGVELDIDEVPETVSLVDGYLMPGKTTKREDIEKLLAATSGSLQFAECEAKLRATVQRLQHDGLDIEPAFTPLLFMVRPEAVDA